MSDNDDRYAAINTGINNATWKVFMGSYTASGTVHANTLEDVTSVPGILENSVT